jgi:MoxR-like ATPase
MFVGASNLLPEDEALNALLDRFLLRVKCDYVNPDQLQEVLLAGWKMERGVTEAMPVITPEAIITLQAASRSIDLEPIRKRYIDVIHSLRNTGIKVSDRRAVKLQNLIAASALLCNRQQAILSDLWVLKYIWDTEEQIEILAGIINNVIENSAAEQAHPQAFYSSVPQPDEVMKEVLLLADTWNTPALSFEQQNVIKDKLRYMQTRCDWIQNSEQKLFIQKEIDGLWQKMLQTN